MKYSRQWWRAHSFALVLAAIIAIGIFFRFYHLDTLPPGLHPDEAANGLNIFRLIDHHDFRSVLDTNGPSATLFIYIQAICVLILGNTILALRLAPAIIGVLAILATYAWVKSWFGRRPALLAATLMAVLPWPVILSRDGFQAVLIPLLLPLTLWLYTRGWQTGRRRWFMAAGISLGAGFYSDSSWLFLPLALLILAVVALIRHEAWRQWLRRLGLSLMVAVIALIPLLVFSWHHPADTLGPQLNQHQSVPTLLSNFGKTALMFNLHGDDNYRYNLGGQPELSVYVGIMFIFGLLLAVARWRGLRYLALLVVLIVMLLPEILSAGGMPQSVLAVGALPIALALAAIGIDETLRLWYGVFPLNHAARSLATGVVAVLLALTGYLSYQQYFVAWAGSTATYEAYSDDLVAMAAKVNQDHFAGVRYVVVDGNSNMTIAYLTHHHGVYTRIDPPDIDQLPAAGGKQFLISRSAQTETIKHLKAKLPGGTVRPQYGFGNREIYYVYEIKP